jgi:D-3-phosphoglycerate dehydrogenase
VADKLIRYMQNGATSTSVNMPNIDLSEVRPETMRILNFHHNQPGVLSKILKILADMKINVTSQKLESNPLYSYVSLDIDVNTDIARDRIVEHLNALEETLWTRTV